MDRVFLDANILFSAAWRADSGLNRLWKLEDVSLVTSSYAVEEAHRNLLTTEQRNRLRELTERLEIVDVGLSEDPLVEGLELPANDRPILAAAIASGATHLLTGDRRAFGPHFGKKVAGVLVLRPAIYLESKHE